MIQTNFLASAIQQFKDYKQLADKTFVQLSDPDFHFRPNDQTNSIAIIIAHMHGNMLSRWTNFLTEDGEKSWRRRDDEFEAHEYPREQLLQLWEHGWQVVFEALQGLETGDLDKTIHIRTKPLSVMDAIHRQLTHYASHVGQIIMMGKFIKGAAWETLSIPKGKSPEFNEQLKRS
jgi:hypothetical protein